MVSCKMSSSSSSTNKVSPDDIIDVRIIEDDPPLLSQQVAEYPAAARDSVDDDDDDTNSLTPFERANQSLYDELRKAYNLDPTGKLRAVAVVVSDDMGKTWVVKADSTETQQYKDQEQWSKVYVESEVAKTKVAYQQQAHKSSPV
jgi:CHASE3 domain sensor protein